MWPQCHMSLTMSLCLSWTKSLKIHCSNNKGSGYLPIKCLKGTLQLLVCISYLPQSPHWTRHCSPSTMLLEEASYRGWDWYPLWEVNISAMGALSQHPQSCQPWARRLNYFEHCRLAPEDSVRVPGTLNIHQQAPTPPSTQCLPGGPSIHWACFLGLNRQRTQNNQLCIFWPWKGREWSGEPGILMNTITM